MDEAEKGDGMRRNEDREREEEEEEEAVAAARLTQACIAAVIVCLIVCERGVARSTRRERRLPIG